MCSHCGLQLSCVESYLTVQPASRRSKKVPNLLQFAKATTPKRKGRKRSQCPRKRKASVPTTAVPENPAYLHVSVTTQLSTSTCQLQHLRALALVLQVLQLLLITDQQFPAAFGDTESASDN